MPPSRGERATARLLCAPPAAGEQRVCDQDGSHARGGAAVASGCAAGPGEGSGVWTGEHQDTQWPWGEVAEGTRASQHGRVVGRRCWQQLRTCIRRCWGSPSLPPSVPLSHRAADRITVAGSAMPSSAHILKVLSIVDFYSECPRVLTFENICPGGLGSAGVLAGRAKIL